MTIKLNTETLRCITALENSTGTRVKDCILEEDCIFYVVEKGKMGMAIGKNGSKIKNLSETIGKRIRLIEFSEDPVQFATNLISPHTANNIYIKDSEGDEGTVKNIIIEADYTIRGAILGKAGKNIKILKELLKRHHDINDVKVE